MNRLRKFWNNNTWETLSAYGLFYGGHSGAVIGAGYGVYDGLDYTKNPKDAFVESGFGAARFGMVGLFFGSVAGFAWPVGAGIAGIVGGTAGYGIKKLTK